MELIHFLVLTLVGLLSAIYGYFKISFRYWQSKGVPYVEPEFPYGSIKGYATKLHPCQFTQRIYNKFKATTKIVGMYYFTRPVILIYDLDLVKNVLVKDFEHFSDRGYYYNKKDDPVTAHIFAVDEPEWRMLRQKLTPTFSSAKMKMMFPTVIKVGDCLREHILKMARSNDEIEMKDLLSKYTTDVIGTCAFGIECNSFENPDAEFRRMGLATFEKPRHGQFIAAFKNNWPELARKLRLKSIRDDVSGFFRKAVRDTVSYREVNGIQRNDFMDLLIKMKNEKAAEQRLTMDEITAQAYLFFMAGYETSSTTMTFCLYELAKNKSVQDKVRDEIRTAFKKHDGQFTYEMMADLSYVDQTILETMRKYPPLGNLPRLVRKDYKIPGTDIVLEKGTNVVIPAFAIQRDPDIYPEPEQFKPERFESEKVKERHSMTWLPFGEGPRNCLGLRFGLIQIRVGLVSILNNFEISLSSKASDPAFDPKLFIITPLESMRFKLKMVDSN